MSRKPGAAGGSMIGSHIRLSSQGTSPARRNFLRKAAGLAMAPVVLSACAGSGPTSTEPDRINRRRQIETDFYVTLERCFAIAPDSRALVARAVGVLVFPTVVATSAVSGAQSGMGALREGNVFSGYFLLTAEWDAPARSADVYSFVFLLTTFGAVNQFRDSIRRGAVDTRPALPTIHPDGRIDTASPPAPLLMLVFDGRSLLAKPGLSAYSIVPLEL
jgi:hypothetical protein